MFGPVKVFTPMTAEKSLDLNRVPLYAEMLASKNVTSALAFLETLCHKALCDFSACFAIGFGFLLKEWSLVRPKRIVSVALMFRASDLLPTPEATPNLETPKPQTLNLKPL